MSLFARVAIDSPLPSLDRLFDYLVSPEIEDSITVGSRVRVSFGRSKKLLDAFVVELNEHSTYDGKLATLSELVSPASVLAPNIYQLLRQLADRQATTLGDTISAAVPRRSVAVEKKFLAESLPLQRTAKRKEFSREAMLANPLSKSNESNWANLLIDRAEEALALGLSAILVVPDFRDQEQLRSQIIKRELAQKLIDYSTEQTNSKRNAAFLKCFTAGAHLVIGSRAAIFAPLQNLGLIAIFDDGDRNLQDQQSPYAHARDIALIRQGIDQCSLLFVAHSRSTEVQRLVDMGYLHETSQVFATPAIAFDESTSRVSSLAWQAIRDACKIGAVLVQVAAKGTARTAYCQTCSTRALCSRCHGPLLIDAAGIARCRWCNAQNMAYKCTECGANQLRQGLGGSTRTAAEFGKAFAGVQVIEATGEQSVTAVSNTPKIVVATPGAEPNCEGGYAAVVIVDAQLALAKDSLRATEDAVRSWSNAISKMSIGGRSVIVGVPAHLGQKFALWKQIDIARFELDNRRELLFPPHVRLGSIEGPVDLIAEIAQEVKSTEVEVLGPIQLRDRTGAQNMRIVLKYPYSSGAQLAEKLRSAQLRVSAGATKTSESGRVSRAIRIRMDDPEVI